MISKQRILVVDSQPIVRNALRLILWNAGCKHISEAENAKQALDRIDIDPPTLIICEIILSDQNGLDLLQQLRTSTSGFANIPFIFLTSQSKTEVTEQASALGANAYLLKPVTAKGLTATLNKVLKTKDAAKV